MAVADRSRWDARYREGEAVSPEPERSLLELEDVLPRSGRDRSIPALAIDFEEAPFPLGPWALIGCVRSFHRATYRAIPGHLAERGLAVVVHPTRLNLERHPRPGLRYLLEPGELPGLLPGLEAVRSFEGWTSAGRPEAHFLGRRPAKGGG